MEHLSTVTSALERAWATIRHHNPDVRPAVMCVYLHPAGDRLGHYWRDSWTATEGRLVDEVHVSSATLAAGATETMITLLHEAAHSLGTAKGQKTTSRQGRYHNARFAALALGLGLDVARHKRLGVHTPSMQAGTMVAYQTTLDDLAGSIKLWQELPGAVGAAPKKGSRNLKAECPACHRKIRLSMKTWKQGAILCIPCSTDFELV